MFISAVLIVALQAQPEAGPWVRGELFTGPMVSFDDSDSSGPPDQNFCTPTQEEACTLACWSQIENPYCTVFSGNCHPSPTTPGGVNCNCWYFCVIDGRGKQWDPKMKMMEIDWENGRGGVE